MIARWRQCTLNAGERVGCSGRMSPHKRGSGGLEISPFVCVFSYSPSEQTDRNVLNVTLDPSPCHPCTDQYALTGGVSEIVCVSSQGGPSGTPAISAACHPFSSLRANREDQNFRRFQSTPRPFPPGQEAIA
jgi:hypothetical protein